MTATDIAEGTYILKNSEEKHDPVSSEPHPVEATLVEEKDTKNVTNAQSS